MRQTIIFFLIVLLMAVSALAVDVTLPKTDFAHGEMVVSSISCAGDAVLRVQNPEGQLIYVDQGQDDWESSYHTNSDSSKGKYIIRVSCEDATNSEQSFCVDSPGCVVAVQGENPPPPPPAADNGNPGGGGGGGSGRRCKAQWDCDVWTFCNATQQQSRPCRDMNNCEKAKSEVRECVPCRESWACSAWSDCYEASQTRNCVDDYDCGTEQYKPTLSKGCDEEYVAGPEPARFSSQISPPKYSSTGARKPAPVVAETEPTFWEQYMVFILGGVALLLAAIVLAVFLLLKRKKQVVYNHDELKDWIKQERAAGTADADIRQILMQQTGWTKEDVERAFSDLSTPAATQPVQSAGAQGVSPVGVKQSSTQPASQTIVKK